MLCTTKIPLDRLQLLGISALLVALKVALSQKYETLNSVNFKLKSLSYECKGGYNEMEIREMEMNILKTLNWKVNFLPASEIVIFLVSNFRYTESNIYPSQINQDYLEWANGFINIAISSSHPLRLNLLEVAMAASLCLFDILDQSMSEKYKQWIINDLPMSRIGIQYDVKRVLDCRKLMLKATIEQMILTGEPVDSLLHLLSTEKCMSESSQESPVPSHKGSTSDNTPDFKNCKSSHDTSKWKMQNEDLGMEDDESRIQVELTFNPTGDLSFDNSPEK